MNQGYVFSKTGDRVVLVVLVLIVGIVAFSNVRATQSYMDVNYIGSGFRFGEPVLDLHGRMILYVDGDDRLSGDIQSSLVDVLIREGVDVVPVDILDENYEDQVLAVYVTERDVDYNPFMPRAEVEVFFAYFSNGDISLLDELRNDEPVELKGDGSGVIQEGRISISDKYKGFSSYPAYLDLLAMKASETLWEHLPKK